MYLDENSDCEYLGAVDPSIIAGAVKGVTNVANNLISMRADKYGAPECGKRPFLPFGKKRRAWEECAQNVAIRNRNMEINSNQENESFLEKYKTPLIIGGISVGGLIAYKIFMK